MKKKFLSLLLTMAMILGVLQAVHGETNLLQNGDFEKIMTDQLPENWIIDAWQSGSTASVTTEKVYKGKYSLKLHSPLSNDVRAVQTVSVKPDTFYRFSGWIAVENVPALKVGANICVMGGYDYTTPLDGTKDWQYVEMYFKTHSKQNSVQLAARLGMYSNDNSGTAYFDELSLVELDKQPDASFAQLSAPSTDNTGAEPDQKPLFGGPWTLILLFILIIAANAYFQSKKKRELKKQQSKAQEIKGQEEAKDQETPKPKPKKTVKKETTKTESAGTKKSVKKETKKEKKETKEETEESN